MARAIFFHSARLNNAIKKMTKLPPFRLHASEPCPIRKHVPKSPPPPSACTWSGPSPLFHRWIPNYANLCKVMPRRKKKPEITLMQITALAGWLSRGGVLSFPIVCFFSRPPPPSDDALWGEFRGKIRQQVCNFWILKFAYLEQIKKLFKILLYHLN